jgi:5-methylcytosine-specific restriction endonuclease McrA
MSPRSKGRTGRPYRRRREQLRSGQAPCHICGKPIDYTLPGTEPMGFVMDHIVPLAYDGDALSPANTAAAHRLCNGRKGKKAMNDVVIIPSSRAW